MMNSKEGRKVQNKKKPMRYKYNNYGFYKKW